MIANSSKIISIAFLGVFLFLLRPLCVQGAEVTDIRFWSASDHTRIVIDLTDAIQYESTSQENPPQLRLELKGVSLQIPGKEIEVKDLFLTKLSLTEVPKSKKVILTLHQKKPLNANVFVLKPYLGKPHRLVIDLVDLVQEKKELEERKKQKETMSEGTKIVVVDPGHGGEDPGAIGPKKTMEKDVVLKIAEKLVRLLNQNKGIKAFLTRKGDYFIELPARRKIAKDYNADLFISLHADASFNLQTRGSSIYCLSLTGATDEAAKILADKENLSDVLGGAVSKTTNHSEDLDQILVDLKQNDTMRESFRFAETLLGEIKTVNLVKYHSYRQAGFMVLKEAKFPSVLVETAFITNKEDERLLNNNKFQEKIAKSLNNAVREYFKP